MPKIAGREAKMREIFETAQKMKSGDVKIAKEYSSVEAFIADAKKQTS